MLFVKTRKTTWKKTKIFRETRFLFFFAIWFAKKIKICLFRFNHTMFRHDEIDELKKYKSNLEIISKKRKKKKRAFNKNWSLCKKIQKLNNHECIDWNKHNFNIYEKTSQFAFSKTLNYEKSSKSIVVFIELSLISSCN